MARSSSSSSSISAATMMSSSATTTSFILLLLSLITEVAAFTTPVSHTTTTALSSAISTAASPRHHSSSSAVTLFAEEGKSDSSSGTTLFFASESADEETAASSLAEETANNSSNNKNEEVKKKVTLFNEETIAEANDALTSVGWAGVAPTVQNGEEGEMTSDDPFVQQIDESIMKEMGVGLDQLLNPAKVVNLERDLYNLRTELASLTGAKLTSTDNNSLTLTTSIADGGGGGDEADAIRTKISKKETDLALERRSVFRGWLKNVFLGQALFSMILSYVMATNPDVLFGNFGWYNNVSNMDTSIKVLGFWWWWLFIVPSLRSRRPTGLEKKALDIAFLGTPLISLLSPVVTKDTGLIWVANFMVVAGAYGFAFTVGNDENDEDDDDGEEGGSKKDPAWLKFIYKSLDFGSGRERGARR